MTEENNQINTVDTEDKAWYKLWLYAKGEVNAADGSIDYDSFVEAGKEIFNVQLKTKT